jgi:outer membrane protein OmpA-like peptidoglycan-associated protein
MATRLLAALLFLSSSLAMPLYASYDKDHPLFAAYPNAKISYSRMVDYEKFTLPLSVVDADKSPVAFTALSLIGDLYRHTYEINNVSSLKVYENYMAAAKALAFKPLFNCELDKCGTDQQVKELGSLIAITNNVYNNYHNPYYWIGEKETPKGKIIAAWFIGAYEEQVNVHQVILEEESLTTGLVKVDSAYASQAGIDVPAAELSADEKAKDHKMLPRYPGAKIYQSKKVDTEVVSIPFAINAPEKKPLKLTGNLNRHAYTVNEVSSLKVYENYKAALQKANFSFISQCELNECGSDQQANELGDQVAVMGNVYNWYRNPYYLLATKKMPSGNVYIALFIGAYESEVGIQQIILEEKAVQTGLVNINADELKQQIDNLGKAMIYGIYFDTGKAEIKSESKPTLDVINELLTRNPSLLLYVVGHTDDTGDGAANVSLSKQRADAVVAELTTNYKIAPHRLAAQGVGPYAPAANNTSDDGKQKNRRVELVSRLH